MFKLLTAFVAQNRKFPLLWGMDFWERLDWLIKERGLSRKELASAVGLAMSAVSVWKSRRAFPDADVALSVARTLGVSVEYLLEGPQPQETGTTMVNQDALYTNLKIPNENRLLQEILGRLLVCDQTQLSKVKEMLPLLLD